MIRLIVIGLALAVASNALAQELPPPKQAPADAAFLVDSLRHRGQGIRRAAFKALIREDVDAVPALLDAVLHSSEKGAVRAAVALIVRLDKLRRTVAADQVELKLTPKERQLIRQLVGVVQNPRAKPWRWHLAVYLLDKLEPDLLRPLMREMTAALSPSAHSMKQYAAVWALHRIGQAGGDAKPALWRLLDSRPRFQGLFIARQTLDDDAVAYNDEVGIYGLLFRLEKSFVIEDLLILETLRRLGASAERITAALRWLARHESQNVRLEVAHQLGVLDEPAKDLAAEVLIRLLSEQNSVLIALLSDEADEIRDETLELFLGLGPAAKKTVPAFTELLSDRDSQLRQSAAIALGRMGPLAQSAVPALKRALKFERLRENDDFESMVEALNRITRKLPNKKPD